MVQVSSVDIAKLTRAFARVFLYKGKLVRVGKGAIGNHNPPSFLGDGEKP